MVKKIKKQQEFSNLPPIDPVYEQAEKTLNLRREIDCKKKSYEEELAVLADMMLKVSKREIRVDGITIKLRVISAKTSIAFKKDRNS